jgi:hypothetical protein
MDHSAVRDVVAQHIDPMMTLLGIPHYHVTLSYGHIDAHDADSVAKGECTRAVSYEQAHIRLNPDPMADDMDVIDVLFHELCHAMLMPFDLYMEACARVIENDPTATAALARVYSHSQETAVRTLDRVWRMYLREFYLDKFTAGESLR